MLLLCLVWTRHKLVQGLAVEHTLKCSMKTHRVPEATQKGDHEDEKSVRLKSNGYLREEARLLYR